MADNFLEKKRAEYELRKAQWLRQKRHWPKVKVNHMERPEDESL